MGCPSGIDWTIVHENGKVKHITDDGHEAFVNEEEYKALIFKIADQVEKFYKESAPKVLPDDNSDRNAYLAFWKEWRHLRDKDPKS